MKSSRIEPGGIAAPILATPVARKIGEPFYVWLMSDLHLGAAGVDYEMIDAELSEAKERGARININGDLLDAILAKDMKRFVPDVLALELQGRRDIVNAAVNFAFGLLAPYAHLIDFIGVGNHETALEKFHSVDVMRLILDRLNPVANSRARGHFIRHGHITGSIRYEIKCTDKNQRFYRIRYHHGAGGGSPVTHGKIDFNRLATWSDGFDLLWLGHKHNRWNGETRAIRQSADGTRHEKLPVRHVMTGAYFETYSDQSQESMAAQGRLSNYAADISLAPQGKGGALVTLIPVARNDYNLREYPNLIRAKVEQ